MVFNRRLFTTLGQYLMRHRVLACATCTIGVAATLFTACIPMPPVTPDPTAISTDHLQPPALFDVARSAFAVVATADRYSGGPVTMFTVTAHVSANDLPVNKFAWMLNGEPVGDSAVEQITIEQSGDHIVEVIATDDQGRTATDGFLLKVFDPSAVADIPKATVTPASGKPGSVVQLRSAALNVAAGFAQVQVGNGSLTEPFRPELGTANVLIPLDSADGLTDTTQTTIRLFVDGVEKESLPFALSPLPPLPGAPGMLIREFLQNGPSLIAQSERDLIPLIDEIGFELSDDERAMMQAMLRLAGARFRQVNDLLLPLLDELDADSLTVIDQLLLANGFDDKKLATLQSGKLIRHDRNRNDSAIDLLCQFHDTLKAVQDAIKGASNAAMLLPLLGLELAGSVASPAIVAMANMISELGFASDLLSMVDEFVPKVDRLEVTATPSTLSNENEKAVIRLNAYLVTSTDICATSLKTLLNQLTARSLAALAKTVPLPRLALIVTRHSFIAFGERGRVETLAEMQSFLQNAISTLTSAALHAGGLDNIYERLRGKLCALESREQLRLQPDPDVVKAEPASGGTFLNLQEESVDFYCNVNHEGPVTIRAIRQCGNVLTDGKPHELRASTEVYCGVEPCTEDAAAVLQVVITPNRQDERESNCEEFEDQIHDRWVDVTFTNTHATRPIALSWILIQESDLRNVDPAPCQRVAQGGFISLQDCLNNRSCGLIQFKPNTTTIVELIYPGETVGPYPYICEQTMESFIDPNATGGTCKDDVTLETVTQRVLAHAVYCDNLDNRLTNFCNVVGRHLHEIGLPWPGLTAIEMSSCP